jgi:hypothetical protein
MRPQGDAAGAEDVTNNENPTRFRLGADTAIGRLLGDEPAGLAVDFTTMQALIRDDALPLTTYLGSPLGLLTYSSTSPKLICDVDGVLRYANHNLALQSQDFSAGNWSKIGGTIAADTQVAPDGTTTADTLTATINTSRFSQSVANWPTASHSFSICAKAGTGSAWMRMYITAGSSATNLSTWFDLANGVIGTKESLAGPASIVSLGNGWYRCTVTTATPGGNETMQMLMASANGATTATVGNTMHFWGAIGQRLPVNAGPYMPTAAFIVSQFGLDHDLATHQPLGVLMEITRINILLWCRDLTNAAWVKTNITAAKNQTGLDGVANSASSITATAANGTCLQTVTIVVNTRTQSAYVKRITGSGTVEMTQDNGATWTPVTVTSAWTRVTIPSQSVTNPVMGFRIATSGDAIAIDFVQNEIGTFATSPIPTANIAITRATDVLTLPLTAFPNNAAAYTLFAAGTIKGTTASSGGGVTVSDGTATNMLALWMSTLGSLHASIQGLTGGVTQVNMVNMGIVDAGSEVRVACAAQLNNTSGVSNGGAALQTDTACLMPIGSTTLYLGCSSTAANVLNGHIRRVKYLPRRVSDAELQAMVA